MKKTLLALPMKDPCQGKTRLAGALSSAERQQLVLALCARTLDFFAAAWPAFDLCVVTASDTIAALAASKGVHLLRESTPRGLNAAATHAAEFARAGDYRHLILVPGDIPVWLRDEVQGVLALTATAEVVIAEAHDGGTNMLILSPAHDFSFQYGVVSARRHEAQAQARGLRAVRCQPPFIGRDLDTPADCLVLSEKLRQVQQMPQHAALRHARFAAMAGAL